MPPAQDLSVTVAGDGQVDATPGFTRCSTVCTTSQPTGTAITLAARPASGVVFAGWSGACAGASLTCALTVDSSATVTATFASSVNLSIGRNGKGVVTSDPAGISCGTRSGSCSAKFAKGASLTLTAAPDSGAVWAGWAGACSGTAPACTITLTGDTSVQASFR